MKTAIYLNHWNGLYHLMLLKVEGEQSHRLDSRFTRSLEQARKAIAYWQSEYVIDNGDVHDNSEVDLDILFSWMDIDLSRELAGQPW